ncbi:MAG: hypothetical protein Q9169_005499 [Polycauliona sp. 2 TL-2023]
MANFPLPGQLNSHSTPERVRAMRRALNNSVASTSKEYQDEANEVHSSNAPNNSPNDDDASNPIASANPIATNIATAHANDRDLNSGDSSPSSYPRPHATDPSLTQADIDAASTLRAISTSTSRTPSWTPSLDPSTGTLDTTNAPITPPDVPTSTNPLATTTLTHTNTTTTDDPETEAANALIKLSNDTTTPVVYNLISDPHDPDATDYYTDDEEPSPEETERRESVVMRVGGRRRLVGVTGTETSALWPLYEERVRRWEERRAEGIGMSSTNAVGQGQQGAVDGTVEAPATSMPAPPLPAATLRFTLSAPRPVAGNTKRKAATPSPATPIGTSSAMPSVPQPPAKKRKVAVKPKEEEVKERVVEYTRSGRGVVAPKRM